MGALEDILPDHITEHALTLSNTELVLPYTQALQAIATATEHSVAILGLEAFEVTKEGLLTLHLADSSRDIRFTGDWKAYVARMNNEADRWLRDHKLGENHGYILTSASEKEFAPLS